MAVPHRLLRRLLVGGLFSSGASVGGAVAGAAEGTCGSEELTSLLQGSLRSVQRHAEDSSALAVGAPERTVDCGESDFVPYPGYGGGLAITGKVRVTSVWGQTPALHRQVLAYHLSGVDLRCKWGPATGGSPNSCGIAIHEGTSCGAHADVLGHYYDSSAVARDPWGCIGYHALKIEDDDPVTACSLGDTAKTGVPPEGVPGHVVVVHDFDGTPAACAIIGKAAPAPPPPPAAATDAPKEFETVAFATNFTQYKDYSGLYTNVAGTVRIDASPDSCPKTPHQRLTYHLSGLDPACSGGPGDAPGSCGVHVHQGVSCDEPLGPLYRRLVRKRDPWTHCAAYTTIGQGAAEERFEVITGVEVEEMVGRVLVVKDFGGSVMACAAIHA